MKLTAPACCFLAMLFLPHSGLSQLCGLYHSVEFKAANTGPDTTSPGATCLGVWHCATPLNRGAGISVSPPGCDGATTTCTVTLAVDLKFPGLSLDPVDNRVLPAIFWFNQATPPTFCGSQGNCGEIISCLPGGGSGITQSLGRTWFTLGLQCSDLDEADPIFGDYSVLAYSCNSSGDCRRKLAVPNLVFDVPALQQALGCPIPIVSGCGGGDSDCSLCKPVQGPSGSKGAADAADGRSGAAPADAGPGANLYYNAGGAGEPGTPGDVAWRSMMGRYWSHDYAMRIVSDSAPAHTHVWLITPFATFREFSGLAAGVYPRDQNAPTDEYRTLYKVAEGWELHGLDGSIEHFYADGFWIGRTGRNTADSKIAVVDATGRIQSLAFPDGRSEVFDYKPDGKLWMITEVGVLGAASRTWVYTFSGDLLTRIDRPDGTAYELFYDATHTGFLTRMDLVGTDLSRRVEAAWRYDASGRVETLWRGDVSPDPPAMPVEKFTFSYVSATETHVADTLAGLSELVFGRDTRSPKPKLVELRGDCPSCTTDPNSHLTYGDASNPLRPTSITDGLDHQTQFSYNATGDVLTRTEAVATPLARTTTWVYGNPSYPGFPTEVQSPSTGGGTRVETLTYNATGDLVTKSLAGWEIGGSFPYVTTMGYDTTTGLLTSYDPPTPGGSDITSYVNDVPGTNHFLVSSMTQPLGLVTSYEYDAYNRRSAEVDPNGVRTETGYDALDRVTSVIRKAAGEADLVTTYLYDPKGDLGCVMLPRGNATFYHRDAAGRVDEIHRGTALASPTAEACLDEELPRERRLLTLDDYGHTINERLQSWSGVAWETAAETGYVFEKRCELKTVVQAPGQPEEATTDYRYDCGGNLEKVWDANHPFGSNPEPTTLYGYDELDRLASVSVRRTTGGPAVTLYEYDVRDHLTRVTDANANESTYVFSDRDLMTAQWLKGVANAATTYSYDPHGNLDLEMDPRGFTVDRDWDELDRIQSSDYSDPTADTTYTYDLASHGLGKLASVARDGITVPYGYDAFGRMSQDGSLVYGYDPNGNLWRITYADSWSAEYTFDHADRERTVLLREPGGATYSVVFGAVYAPFGPVRWLGMSNDIEETRGFDRRYAPTTIVAARGKSLPPLLSWTYATDDVGNILGIADDLEPANDRTYGYEDFSYFLTAGDGPWGTRSWSYDRIGNRVAGLAGGQSSSYGYFLNPASQATPRLQAITGADAATYSYDAVGNVEEELLASPVDFVWSRASNLIGIAGAVQFRYDGRSYLSDATLPPFDKTAPTTQLTYSSTGRLLELKRTDGVTHAYKPVYLAGRPVAQLRIDSDPPQVVLSYYTTDHLGTPVLVTDSKGELDWEGGFEPFGEDYTAAMKHNDVLLGFPGQVSDLAWYFDRPELKYNVHRWYETVTGRYVSVDPLADEVGTVDDLLRRSGAYNLAELPGHLADLLRDDGYSYAKGAPVRFSDPDGRATTSDGLACFLWKSELTTSDFTKDNSGADTCGCPMRGACRGTLLTAYLIRTVIPRPYGTKCPSFCATVGTTEAVTSPGHPWLCMGFAPRK